MSAVASHNGPGSGLALLTANLRSECERSWSHGAHGLDSVAYRFRPGRPGFVDELLRHPHRERGGALVLEDSADLGVRVAVFGSVIRVEGRLDPLLSGHRDTWELRPATDTVPGERAARRLVERYASTAMDRRGHESTAEVGRLDLAHELRFEDSTDGLAFLATTAALRPSLRKAKVITAADGTVQTVYFVTPKAAAVRERIYDKGVESGSHRPGRRVRIEAQRRFTKKTAMTSETVPTLELPRLYGEKIAPYAVAETVAVGRDQAQAELMRRVGAGDLSMAKAERMLGTIAVLHLYGRAAWPESSARRRLAESIDAWASNA